jgi:hypothetical protein
VAWSRLEVIGVGGVCAVGITLAVLYFFPEPKPPPEKPRFTYVTRGNWSPEIRESLAFLNAFKPRTIEIPPDKFNKAGSRYVLVFRKAVAKDAMKEIESKMPSLGYLTLRPHAKGGKPDLIYMHRKYRPGFVEVGEMATGFAKAQKQPTAEGELAVLVVLN